MNHGSLFSGIGGFDLAAEWMGWENKFHCDINPFSRKICSFYWPDAVSYEDIKTTDFRVWRDKIDVLSGGFPCQPFSTAGKRMGKEDERHLWPFMFKAIKEIRPKYVVGENVRGLLNWSDGLVLEEVFSDLESEGYEVQAFVLPAVGISAPHRRDRVFIVAHANSDAGRSESYQGGCTECKTDSDGQSSLYSRTESASNEGTTTHTDSRGLERTIEVRRDSVNVVRESEFGFITDTERLRLELGQIATDLSSISSETQTQGGQSAIDTSPDDYVRTQQGGPSETWVNFPTKSPLCSGDDGLPHELDGLAFPKWRKESIMGYGNAIIPQIAHRIFQTIHATEQ